MSARTRETLYSAGGIAGVTSSSAQNTADHQDRQTFRIVFWGQCARGYQPESVKKAFAKRFKIASARKLEQLFSGKVRTLKKGLNETQANRYVNAILEMGAICRKESEFRNYFAETEVMQRKSVSFLEDDFDPNALSLTPKDEFSPEH